MALSFSRPDPSQPSSVSTAAFALSRRGYDQAEVRDFLRMVAAELARLQEREKFLEHELRQAQRSGPTQAVALDEEVVTRMLGEEAARILQTARDGAAAIKTRAEEHCHRMVREVTDEAERLRTEVEMEVARRRQDSITDSEAEINMAKQQGREMVNEARAYREKVLGELNRRREMARQQIEQLVHGRDRLVQAFERARLAANDVLGELTPLIEPDEFVNLSPTTGPVPLMVPNMPPPAARRAADMVPEPPAESVAERAAEGGASAGVASEGEASDRREATHAGDSREATHAGDSREAEPQVYDVEHEADDQSVADVLSAAVAAVATTTAASAPAGSSAEPRPANTVEATTEVATEAATEVESTVSVVQSAEPEVERVAAVAAPEPPAVSSAASNDHDDESDHHDEHDDRPIAPVVSIFGGSGESSRVREPEVPLPPTAPVPPKHTVDDLFARLRASRPDAVAARVDAPGTTAEPPVDTAAATASADAVEPPAPAVGRTKATPTAPAVAPVAEAPVAKAARPRTKVVTEKIAGAKVVERVPVDEPPAPVAKASKSTRSKAAEVGHPSAPAASERSAKPSIFERTQAPEPEAAGDADAGDDDSTPFSRREAALVPIIASASRKVKRVLADEQNDVLELLRRKEPVRSLDAVVPKAAEHIARSLDTIADDLVAAALAGAASLDTGSAAAHKKAIAAADATRVAREHIANVLIDPLRERLDRDIANAAGINADIADSVRGLYREWKSHRIDAAIDDAVRQAFGSGALAAVPAGTKLLWMVDPDGPASPDCDDNALAGAVAAGDPFPTDHVCAPAHPGCRCMLVRAPR